MIKITLNGEDREIVENSTISSLLSELELEPRTVAVELNQDIAPRERFSDQQLASGDVIEIVTLVGGG